MNRIVPASLSLVLRTSHVAAVRFASVRSGNFGEAPGGGRPVEAMVALEEMLRGSVRERAGDEVQVRLVQLPRALPRRDLSDGVWGNHDLAPGSRFVVLASVAGPGPSLAELLPEPACLAAFPADAALESVRAATRAEAEGRTARELLEDARLPLPALDETFAEYAWVRLAEPAYADPATFEAMARLIERPEIGTAVRLVLLDRAGAELSFSTHATPWHVHRLAIACFRLLRLREAASLHREIARSHLPNLLGIIGSAPKRTAGEVFRDFPGERAAAGRAVEEAGTAELLEWFRAG